MHLKILTIDSRYETEKSVFKFIIWKISNLFSRVYLVYKCTSCLFTIEFVCLLSNLYSLNINEQKYFTLNTSETRHANSTVIYAMIILTYNKSNNLDTYLKK